VAGTGIRRNPEEYGENTGVPVLQEFLRKIPVMASKNRNSCDLSKTTSCEKFLRKTQGKKETSGILFFSVFEPQKMNS
jgi:hypothetical protein